MSITEQEIDELKSAGIFAEKGKTRFSVRLLVIGGFTTAEQLRSAAALSKRYGDGTVHLTTRQGIEIPHIPYEKLPRLRKALAETPLLPARSGACVRAVTACPGTYCKFGFIDTQGLAREIFRRFSKYKNMPHKFKIAVGGCQYNCAKPNENDLGIMGAPDGFVLIVGGMAGKTPRWGDKLPEIVKDKKTLYKKIKAVLDWYIKNGRPKERLGTVMERLGLAALLRDI